MTTTPDTTRWGIRGADWHDIRPIPRGEDDARAWAVDFANGSRKTAPETITVYRDTGNGWEPVDTYEARSTS